MILDISIDIDLQSNKVDDFIYFCKENFNNTSFDTSEGFDDEIRCKCYCERKVDNYRDKAVMIESEKEDIEYLFWSNNIDVVKVEVQ